MIVEYEGLRFERLGHTSVRIETETGTVIYIDPWSEGLDSERGDGDIVLVTHDDTDHYDPDGIAAVAGGGVTVAAYEEVDTSSLPFDVISLPHKGTTTVDGIDVRSIPAYNDPNGAHVDEEGSPYHAEAEGIGLMLTIEEKKVFFAGDTDFLDHHESETTDVFIPPIGGHYTMNRHEAAAFARSLDPELVLPVHYDTFEAIKTDAEAFATELEADGIRVELF